MSARSESQAAFDSLLLTEGEAVTIAAVPGKAIVSDPVEDLSFVEQGSRNRERKSLKVSKTDYANINYKDAVTYEGASWKVLQKSVGLISWSILIDRIK